MKILPMKKSEGQGKLKCQRMSIAKRPLREKFYHNLSISVRGAEEIAEVQFLREFHTVSIISIFA